MTEHSGPRGWGILGGTFDPIHYAHLAIGEHVCDVLALEGIIYVPASVPPHKGDRVVTPVLHRLGMLELAIADNPRFRCSRVEIDRPGKSYTVDTVERLRSVDGLAPLTLVMSAEALAGLPEWRSPERILDLCRVAVVPRLGHRPAASATIAAHFPGREDRFVLLDGPHLGHSASAIRRLAADGRSIRYLVPPDVERYIVDHALYRPDGTPTVGIDATRRPDG